MLNVFGAGRKQGRNTKGQFTRVAPAPAKPRAQKLTRAERRGKTLVHFAEPSIASNTPVIERWDHAHEGFEEYRCHSCSYVHPKEPSCSAYQRILQRHRAPVAA